MAVGLVCAASGDATQVKVYATWHDHLDVLALRSHDIASVLWRAFDGALTTGEEPRVLHQNATTDLADPCCDGTTVAARQHVCNHTRRWQPSANGPRGAKGARGANNGRTS